MDDCCGVSLELGVGCPPQNVQVIPGDNKGDENSWEMGTGEIWLQQVHTQPRGMCGMPACCLQHWSLQRCTRGGQNVLLSLNLL